MAGRREEIDKFITWLEEQGYCIAFPERSQGGMLFKLFGGVGQMTRKSLLDAFEKAMGPRHMKPREALKAKVQAATRVIEIAATGREDLVGNLSFALTMHSVRILGGTYQISLRRIGKNESACDTCGFHHEAATPCLR